MGTLMCRYALRKGGDRVRWEGGRSTCYKGKYNVILYVSVFKDLSVTINIVTSPLTCRSVPSLPGPAHLQPDPAPHPASPNPQVGREWCCDGLAACGFIIVTCAHALFKKYVAYLLPDPSLIPQPSLA